MTLCWSLRLLIGALLVISSSAELFSSSSISASACVAQAVDAGRRLFAAQEIFYKCYKECVQPLSSTLTSDSGSAPDFTSNFYVLAKTAGISFCAKSCFEKIAGEMIPANLSSDPFYLHDKVVEKLLKCSVDDVNDAFFAGDLAQFNIDLLNHAPTFLDPRKRRLFNVFYPDVLQSMWAAMSKYDQSSRNCPDILSSMRASFGAYLNNMNLCQHWCLIRLANQTSDQFMSLVTISRCQLSCFYQFRSDPSPAKSLLHPAAEMLHYLQYCSFHLNKLNEAVAFAASYTLLEPSDNSVYEYYVDGGKVSKADFKATPEAIHLKEQLNVLNSVVKMYEDFKQGIVASVPSSLAAAITSMKSYDTSSAEKADAAVDGFCDASNPTQCKLDSKRYRVVANFSGIDSHRRYVTDDIITNDQCKLLVNLNTKAGKNGDGYPATKKHGSPYTDHESYVGLAAHRLAELAADGVLSPEEVLSYFSVTDSILERTKQLYGLKDLYFYYVHLVCREAVKLKGETEPDRIASEDPSHPIHADNCAITPTGDCLYNDPLLIPRNYSSVLYLNDDFEGGEFFFAHRPNKTEDRRVNPRCGRLVSFHASEFHGVRAVTQGTRCSLAIWFTLDKTKEEQARANAYRIVKQLAEMRESIPPEPVGPEISGRAY